MHAQNGWIRPNDHRVHDDSAACLLAPLGCVRCLRLCRARRARCRKLQLSARRRSFGFQKNAHGDRTLCRPHHLALLDGPRCGCIFRPAPSCRGRSRRLRRDCRSSPLSLCLRRHMRRHSPLPSSRRFRRQGLDCRVLAGHSLAKVSPLATPPTLMPAISTAATSCGASVRSQCGALSPKRLPAPFSAGLHRVAGDCALCARCRTLPFSRSSSRSP